ncbi:MAG: AlpA family phage regulatory protein [Moraxellaceae bacterium]|nr:AlpA family phage regulatory protein [Moraxellaceae bacterium]
MPPKMLRLPQVVEYTGIGRSTIYNLMDPESPSYDPSFPTQVELTLSTVGWVEAEVYAGLSRNSKRGQRSTEGSLKAKSKKRKTHLTSNNSSQYVV